MAWVIGITEVRFVRPPREGRQAIPEPVRVIRKLSPEAVAETLRGDAIALPLHTGAGPCGTYARATCTRRLVDPAKFHGQRSLTADRPAPFMSPTVIAWSIRHLIEPLRAYYATYEPPKRFGAKPGPRGRHVHDEAYL